MSILQGKLESRLSILALLAPSSPARSPPHAPDYCLPTVSAVASPHSDHTLPSKNQDDAAGCNAAKLQALLPRPSEQQQPSRLPPPNSRQSGVAVPRRIATIVACENCRAKRTKCDGARPKCSRCVRLGTDCEYDAGPDETRSIARKRKYDEMKSDLSDMQELYEYLRSRPLVEVAEVIRRIRSNTDPCKVLSLVRDGDLLLQASAIGRRGIETDVEDVVRKLDETAYQQSPLKLSAKKWTDVAGDGLVSELVSIFFDLEQPFATNYVDRHCFLQDMGSEQTENARFCSPALVNAICAIGAFTSETAKAIDQARGGCVRERFYNEAKKQLDLEHGKVSLPTVMALYNLFLYSSEAGIDRAGTFYRVSCSEMYKKLRLGSEFPSWVDNSGPSNREQYRRAVSRAAWGLFCIESKSSFVYIQPALIAPPTIPRIFGDNLADTPPAEADSYDAILDAECSISKLLYEIMCYNVETRDQLGEEQDISFRLSYYRKLLDWEAPTRGSSTRGLFGLCQSFFLECYFSIAVIALFRPLALLTSALPDGLRPAELVLQHCKRMVERTREMKAAYPLEYAGGCLGTLYFFYVCSISLVALLDQEPSSHEPFVEACQYFHLVAGNFPVGPALLRGLQALALETGVGLPRECEAFFSEARLANGNFKDVPVSYVIPQSVAYSESEAGVPGLELGNLIEKWSTTMSI
ncbi:hypothetical protein CONLIGDRAFT_648885 [Coniochaeta ligniaria NRRL 30616]|uniref:Zn(2)-C6 fungal-type domain-containing protein n=1 Tax=Coniochaeta ligniaria NRRL 30616 TaxID=1408157 RepID=A0A1J7IBS8_9PEZI|nr:hypothetical protein CONLIGDRAFT_648885 [Coniochaeta ligniaria NRRL 30616]